VFGDQLYRLNRDKLVEDGHTLIEHLRLLAALREEVKNEDKGARLKAVQALRYARLRAEGLVEWSFDLRGLDPRSRFRWAAAQIRPYFARA